MQDHFLFKKVAIRKCAALPDIKIPSSSDGNFFLDEFKGGKDIFSLETFVMACSKRLSGLVMDLSYNNLEIPVTDSMSFYVNDIRYNVSRGYVLFHLTLEVKGDTLSAWVKNGKWVKKSEVSSVVSGIGLQLLGAFLRGVSNFTKAKFSKSNVSVSDLEFPDVTKVKNRYYITAEVMLDFNSIVKTQKPTNKILAPRRSVRFKKVKIQPFSSSAVIKEALEYATEDNNILDSYSLAKCFKSYIHEYFRANKLPIDLGNKVTLEISKPPYEGYGLSIYVDSDSSVRFTMKFTLPDTSYFINGSVLDPNDEYYSAVDSVTIPLFDNFLDSLSKDFIINGKPSSPYTAIKTKFPKSYIEWRTAEVDVRVDFKKLSGKIKTEARQNKLSLADVKKSYRDLVQKALDTAESKAYSKYKDFFEEGSFVETYIDPYLDNRKGAVCWEQVVSTQEPDARDTFKSVALFTLNLWESELEKLLKNDLKVAINTWIDSEGSNFRCSIVLKLRPL